MNMWPLFRVIGIFHLNTLERSAFSTLSATINPLSNTLYLTIIVIYASETYFSSEIRFPSIAGIHAGIDPGPRNALSPF